MHQAAEDRRRHVGGDGAAGKELQHAGYSGGGGQQDPADVQFIEARSHGDAKPGEGEDGDADARQPRRMTLDQGGRKHDEHREREEDDDREAYRNELHGGEVANRDDQGCHALHREASQRRAWNPETFTLHDRHEAQT